MQKGMQQNVILVPKMAIDIDMLRKLLMYVILPLEEHGKLSTLDATKFY
jgi:hypothetical protein